MNIYSVLSSKPHNSHYLNRYIKFIESCNNIKEKYKTDLHHICPKSLFPEFKDLNLNIWNGKYLTKREHFIAHWILYKIYGGSMANAFYRFSHTRSSNYNKIKSSKLYEKIKIESNNIVKLKSIEWYKNNPHPKGMKNKRHSDEFKKSASDRNRGENNPMYGKKRPDLSARNKDPVIAKYVGRKSGDTCIRKKINKLLNLIDLDEKSFIEYFSKYVGSPLYIIYENSNKNISKENLRYLLYKLKVFEEGSLKQTYELMKEYTRYKKLHKK